jgi:hypothetical protein
MVIGEPRGLLLQTSRTFSAAEFGGAGLGGEQSLDIQGQVQLQRKPVRSRRIGFLF